MIKLEAIVPGLRPARGLFSQLSVLRLSPTATVLTNGVCVKEEDWRSQYGAEHPVMQHSRGIHTHIVEQNGSGKVDQDGKARGASVDANALVRVESTCTPDRHIVLLEEGDVEC